ncbi:Hypothetical protein PHPALM_6233 [Phytophthora palmivora]|uniref:Uncharacterized protein n=1 Tax=Phytophthora palmivora TaxID=4796 RepID=A0A2P4YFC3_9STRA|nr:Hypothetical protein PHPALM_6233 [Phytophthora palmivora]
MAGGSRFTVNPFPDLVLTAEDRSQLIEIAQELVMAKFTEYQEHINNQKYVDMARWKKYSKDGNTMMYLERKKSNPESKLPALLMVGPLPGSLDENMFGLVSPTLESMRIKSSYLKDFNAAAVLATIVEPTVEEPFRSVVVKWMEIDIPGASIGFVRNRDYIYLESTGILRLDNVVDTLLLTKFEEYEEYLNDEKRVDLTRWKKFLSAGAATTYIERKKSNPDSKLPQFLMVGPLPGTLDENMFGMVNPTLESMRIKSSYLDDFSAAAVLAMVVEPTVDDPFRAVVVKWMEIDIPGASIGVIKNRDYVYVESTGIMKLRNGAEVKLCGHATLSTAFALHDAGHVTSSQTLHFHTLSGVLVCRFEMDPETNKLLVLMDFPEQPTTPAGSIVVVDELASALGIQSSAIVDVKQATTDLLVRVSPEAFSALKPDFVQLGKTDVRGFAITAEMPQDNKSNVDIQSRFFGPRVGVNEDPVTGSAHCALGPYWAPLLKKTTIKAQQFTPLRGGYLTLDLVSAGPGRVLLKGEGVVVLRGHLSSSP